MSKILLKDNQEYDLSPHNEWGTCLLSRRDNSSPIKLPRKEWKEIWGWLSLEKNLQEELEKNALMLIGNEDAYEHTTKTFYQTKLGTNASFVVTTGNLVGCVWSQSGKDSIEIGSRFGNQFLQYIISDAEGFLPIPQMGGNSYSDSGFHWLMAYIWSCKLRHAYRLGKPKRYREENEKLNYVRGEISPVDYQMNASTGKLLCRYRDLSFNTRAAELFIAAYQLVKSYPGCSAFCSNVHRICQDFTQAVSGHVSKRKELLATPHFSNTYYMDYNEVIDLSKKILTFWGSEYSGNKKSDAIFFDVAMLFEFFVRKLLQRNGFRMKGKNEILKYIPTIPLEGEFLRKLIPDLVFDVSGGYGVFDVKYKYYNQIYGVSREDLFQLHTYIAQYANDASIKASGFIFPIMESRWRKLRQGKDISKVVLCDKIVQHKQKIPFIVGFIVIPDDENDTMPWEDFRNNMFKWCELFIEQMHSISTINNIERNFGENIN